MNPADAAKHSHGMPTKVGIYRCFYMFEAKRDFMFVCEKGTRSTENTRRLQVWSIFHVAQAETAHFVPFC
jgi:hypothetical protein